MPTNVIMPQMGESIFEGTLTRWLKAAGARVIRDEPLFEISTDKVDSEIPAPASGVLSEIKVKEGETVPVDTVVAVIDESVQEAADAPPESAVATAGLASIEAGPVEVAGKADLRRSPKAVSEEIRSSPLVRRIAQGEKVDLRKLEGTGLGGRITKKDILGYLATRQQAAPSALRGEPIPGVSSSIPAGRAEAVPMSAMRKSIAERMVASRRTSAHATTVFEADMTRIVNLKLQQEQEFLRREGVKLSFMPFFLTATAATLKEFPLLNASIVEHDIIYRKDINLGVAVALDWGLIVPVIKNADEKSFLGLARAMADFAERARQKKLTPADVQGGTFTITNPGVFGSLLGTPIINQPQVGILCIGTVAKRPVVVNDAIAIRSMVYLTLTFDHRLIDGALADHFMVALKARLEGWEDGLS